MFAALRLDPRLLVDRQQQRAGGGPVEVETADPAGLQPEAGAVGTVQAAADPVRAAVHPPAIPDVPTIREKQRSANIAERLLRAVRQER
jgi:hypothetical protein